MLAMKTNIKTQAEIIESTMHYQKYDIALDLCDSYINDNPNSWYGYIKKSEALYSLNDRHGALEVARKLYSIESKDPADYCHLIRILLIFGQIEERLRWAKFGITLSFRVSKPYYLQALYLYKAFTLIKLDLHSEALEVCAKLNDGYSSYIAELGILSKENLVQDAKAGMRKQKALN